MNKNVDLRIKKVESVESPEMSELMLILEKSFATAMEYYPKDEGEMPTPSGEDIVKLWNEGKDVLAIYDSSKLIGGAVISADHVSGNNTVELLFISADEKGKGLGTQAWKAIERRYPDTKKWELGTLYFLKQNIHFYINKCGFHITKYYNKWNPFISEDKVEDGDFFWFEKEME